MRHDIRAALDQVLSEATQASAAAIKQQSSAAPVVCWKCSSPPALGGKLRYCDCAALPYCSKKCAKDHWAKRKLVCASMRKTRAKELSDHVAQGGRKQEFSQMRRDLSDDVVSWFEAVPGLICEIVLLARVHLSVDCFIHASVSDQSHTDGSDVRVEMIPRSFWDEDPRFLEPNPDTLRNQLRQVVDGTSICPTMQYVCVMTMRFEDWRSQLHCQTHSWALKSPRP
jgi:hypothetical protein